MTKFTHYRDELGSVEITVFENDIVSLALLGLPKIWHSYQDSVNGRENLLDLEQLWSNLVQEEFRQNTRDGTSSKEVEENFALVIKGNKYKGNKSQGEEGDKKKDLAKVKCFQYHKHEHYDMNFPQKKGIKKEPAVATAGEALTS